MPRYTLITGEYHIFYPDIPRNGPQPDGDTVSFRPDDPLLIEALPRQGRPPNFNRRGIIPIRFEGIDALETHFKQSHQHLELANAARDWLLAAIGFTGVKFWEDLPNNVEAVDVNPLRGHILASGLDSNGRVLAFAYGGDSDIEDGTPVFLDTERMMASLNVALLRANLVYATFYTSLPVSLLGPLREAARAARTSGAEIWASESLNTDLATEVTDIPALEELVMWPKLFRRLIDYFAAGNTTLASFDAWLRADPIHRDDRLLLPNGELGNMHDVISVDPDNNAMRLNYNPEELVILPEDA
jgi:hypothetical protein